MTCVRVRQHLHVFLTRKKCHKGRCSQCSNGNKRRGDALSPNAEGVRRGAEDREPKALGVSTQGAGGAL